MKGEGEQEGEVVMMVVQSSDGSPLLERGETVSLRKEGGLGRGREA